MSMRLRTVGFLSVLGWSVLWWCLAGIARGGEWPTPRRDPARLSLLQPQHPRAFFFRASEGAARRPGTEFDAWEADFSRLMGIMGKCLDEEVPGTLARNAEFFTRFKQRHPDQAVLLHFNGNARDPLFQTENYFPGHWIYRRATRILGDVPAEAGESVIHVEDASDFHVRTGRYRNAADDVALLGITPDGHHDWARCEQVQLLDVDYAARTIRVRRGAYGTRPLAFAARQARAAAHAVEGPWGRKSHLLWLYNFATHCPRDAQGRSCADVLVDDLDRWLGPGGPLAALDGLEFDVMFHETRGDTDGDGAVDDGVVGGLNRYGLGTIALARQLRARLGEKRILLADGALGAGGRRSQRAFAWLNGIESEGWPNLNDWEFEDWSGGLHRLLFWQAAGRPPVFNYINHKWLEAVAGQPGEPRHPQVPFSRHRLAFAGAVFTDAMICYSFAPPADADGRFGIWDELRGGTRNQLAWLGRAEGAAVHLAASAPDQLQGLGRPPAAELARRIRGEVVAEVTPAGLTIAPADPAADTIQFDIAGVPTHGRDLVILLTLRAAPLAGYPPEMARFAEVGIAGGMRRLVTRQLPRAGMQLRGQPEGNLDPRTGASIRYVPGQEINAQTLPAYAVHPPYKGGTGRVFWWRDVDLPAGAELRFALGMGPLAPARSDGVWFQVDVAPLAAGKPGPFTRVFEKSSKAHQWLPQTVRLDRWEGQRVRLKFVADCGPADHATTDHALWGDVRIAAAGQAEDASTAPEAHMTWVRQQPFAAAFYFRHVRSPTVDVRCEVEGRESVTLEAISAHAHPDALYRLFEHGLVLANPSLEPYTFDLAAIAPGRRYQRLQATARQDTEFNNGRPAEPRLTLGPRDAIFLQRMSAP